MQPAFRTASYFHQELDSMNFEKCEQYTMEISFHHHSSFFLSFQRMFRIMRKSSQSKTFRIQLFLRAKRTIKKCSNNTDSNFANSMAQESFGFAMYRHDKSLYKTTDTVYATLIKWIQRRIYLAMMFHLSFVKSIYYLIIIILLLFDNQ